MSHAIILGDIHLGKGLGLGRTGIGSSLNSRLADQIALLDWVLDLAIERHIEHIILTGDIFEDPRPGPQLYAIFISWLKRGQANGVTFHIIMGNHDLFRTGLVFTSSLDVISEIDLDNVSVYKDTNTVLIDSSAFTLMPFRDRKSFATESNADALSMLRDTLVYELAGIPVTYKKVLVGHLAIEGSIPIGDEIDDMTNELFCPTNMFAGYDYVWMGHVHKPQIMKKKNPYVAHIGSMDISNFGETDHQKHIVIFDCLSPDNDFTIEYLPTRPLKKLTISVPKDTADTTEYVLEAIKKENLDFSKAIVKVEVSLTDPELKSVNKSTIEKALMSQGAFNVTGVSENKKVALIKRDTNNTIDTKMDVSPAIKTYAKTYIDELLRDAFIELAMEIYSEYKVEAKE